MKLNKSTKIFNKKKKKVGRGYGSGKGGHTVGKGMKGQASRSGFKKVKGWIRESKIRSLPKLRGIGKRSAKRGYVNSKVNYVALNVSDLNVFSDGEVINRKILRETGVIKGKGKKITIKILGQGEVKKKLVIEGLQISEVAKKKIVAAGGKVRSIEKK